jgi:hypothetical protein
MNWSDYPDFSEDGFVGNGLKPFQNDPPTNKRNGLKLFQNEPTNNNRNSLEPFPK